MFKSTAMSGDKRLSVENRALSCRAMLTTAAFVFGILAAGTAQAITYTYQGDILSITRGSQVISRVTATLEYTGLTTGYITPDSWNITGLDNQTFYSELEYGTKVFNVFVDTNLNIQAWDINLVLDIPNYSGTEIKSSNISGDHSLYRYATNPPCGMPGTPCRDVVHEGNVSTPGVWSPIFDPAVMVQPKDAVVISGGDTFSIVNTYNQAGLEANYIDEQTRLDSFAPTLHTPEFPCCEWFSDFGTSAATVSYFVNANRPANIDHLVLWNEETSGIGSFDLYYGETAGALTTLLLEAISPFDNLQLSYAGEVFRFDASPKVGWYTIVARDCPQNNPGGFLGCAIGEVAFGGPAGVPEPASWAMLIAGFGMTGAAMRRRAVQAA